jgi:hypothetical protein
MVWNTLNGWLNNAPLLILGGGTLILMTMAVGAGVALRAWNDGGRQIGKKGEDGGLEGYVVSAVLGLLALLMGFTFSLAVDRFETRRTLVLEEANAIGTTYLRAQLLEQPHRERISQLLVNYTDNRIALAKAPPDRVAPLLAANDRMLTDLWAATASAFVTIKGIDFSSTFVDGVNNVIDLDAARKTARMARVPSEVFFVLFVYLVVTAGVLGYVFVGNRGRGAAIFMLVLLTLSLLLILDIDRPNKGGIRESQTAMEQLRATFKSQPPTVFDRYLIEDAKAAEAKPS